MAGFLPLILKNSLRNRRRTALTILSMGFSLCLLGVLLAVYHAFYFSDPPPEQALRLVTRNRVSLTFPLPESYRNRIRQIPGVREVMISQWFGGVYKDRRDPKNLFARFAVEPDKIFTILGEISVPEDQKRAFQRDRTACLVGRALAERLGWKLGDHVTIQGDIFPVNLELTIRAIYDAPHNNEVLYFNRTYLEESLGGRLRGNAGTFYILADSAESAPRIARAVDDAFRNSPAQTKTESESAFALGFVSMLGNVKLFLLSICGAVTFTILLVAANTMAMSTRERVREVGVLKTLGFTPPIILSLLLGEAVMISIAGGLIGLLLASLLCGVVRNGPLMFGQLRSLSIQPSVALLSLLTAAFIGLASSAIPAWGASRTSIIQALRSED